jgi:hypothetical protein
MSRLLCVAAIAWVSGCADPNLKPAKMPEGGVRLSHDLRPGTQRAVDVRVEIDTPADTAQRIDAGGTWTVAGDGEDGGVLLRARFERIELAWPEATDATEAKVTATDVEIHVKTGGAAAPKPVQTGDAVADAVLGALGDAVAQSIVVAPPRPVKRADDWTWAPPPGTTGDLEAAVDGLYRTVDRDEEVAALTLRQRGRITEGAATNDFVAHGRAWFATAGYVSLFERTVKTGATTKTISVRARPS